MKSVTVTHDEQLDISEGKKTSTKLPVGVTYGEIRIYVEGAYTKQGADVVDTHVPTNIFREINLKVNNNVAVYGLSSEDVYKMNYYDYASKVVYEIDTVNHTFKALVKLDKAALLADQDVIPKETAHPSLPITQMQLELTWCTAADFFSTLTTSTIDSATATVIYQQIQTSMAELQGIYGAKFERYALPSMGAKYTASLAANTKLSEVLNVGTGNLIKKAILLTTDGSNVEKDDRISDFQVKRTLPTPAVDLVTEPFAASQADDLVYYRLDAGLTGVTVIDFDADVSMDGKGIYGGGKEEALKLYAKIAATTIIRWISEEYAIADEARAPGSIIVFGVPQPMAA